MKRPTLQECAQARAELQRYCATNKGSVADAIRMLLRQSAPFSREEVSASIDAPSIASQHGATSDMVMSVLKKYFGG